jgi:hypothetical protein
LSQSTLDVQLLEAKALVAKNAEEYGIGYLYFGASAQWK